MAGPGDNLKKDDPYYNYSHRDLITRIYRDGNGDPEYIGRAIPGIGEDEEGWQIKKLFYTAGIYQKSQFAGGSNRYDKIMDDYAGYSYS